MNDDEVTIQQWIGVGGGRMINSDALSPDHPQHTYNQILAQGKRPEDYGIQHPYAEEFQSKTRNELIHEIVAMRKELVGLHRAGAAGFF